MRATVFTPVAASRRLFPYFVEAPVCSFEFEQSNSQKQTRRPAHFHFGPGIV
jgi:hypothetical protein